MIAARLHEAKRVDLDFGAFVEHPILKDLAAFVDTRRPGSVRDDFPRARANRARPAPLSVIQSRHWKKAPSSRYTNAACWRIDGPLDIDVLRLSLNAVVARHEILRTRYDVPPQPFKLIRRALRVKTKGLPHQYVQPPAEVALPFIDLSGMSDAEMRLDALISMARATQFDLTSGPPLSFTLVRLGPERHAMVEASHHIIRDGPSWNVFLHDLAHFYEARLHGREPTLAPLDIQYADYALWERERLKPGSPKFEAALKLWAHEFADVAPAPESGWLAAYKWQDPPAKVSPQDGAIACGLDAATSERLDSLGKTLNATYLAVRLATLLPLCAMAVGHDNVVIGMASTIRTRVELQRMFGPLYDFLNVPMTCDWKSSFGDLIGYAQQRLIAIRADRGVPQRAFFAEYKSRGIATFPAVLKIQIPTSVSPVHFGGLKLTRTRVHRPALQGVFVSYDDEQEGCLLKFDACIYSDRLMQEFVSHAIAFIRAAANDPNARLQKLIEADGVGAALRERLPGKLGTEAKGAARTQ